MDKNKSNWIFYYIYLFHEKLIGSDKEKNKTSCDDDNKGRGCHCWIHTLALVSWRAGKQISLVQNINLYLQAGILNGKRMPIQHELYLVTNFAGTGKSLLEALIFASTNPQYDYRLFIQYMKIPSWEHGKNMLCIEIVLTFRKNFVHNMFSSCSAKLRASDKDLPVNCIIPCYS